MTEALEFYHRFLAVNYFARSRGKEFWDYHKARLKELGYPLTRIILLKAAVRTILRESVNPGQAIAKLRRHLFPPPPKSDLGTEQARLGAKGMLAEGWKK